MDQFFNFQPSLHRFFKVLVSPDIKPFLLEAYPYAICTIFKKRYATEPAGIYPYAVSVFRVFLHKYHLKSEGGW